MSVSVFTCWLSGCLGGKKTIDSCWLTVSIMWLKGENGGRHCGRCAVSFPMLPCCFSVTLFSSLLQPHWMFTASALTFSSRMFVSGRCATWLTSWLIVLEIQRQNIFSFNGIPLAQPVYLSSLVWVRDWTDMSLNKKKTTHFIVHDSQWRERLKTTGALNPNH